MALSRHSVRATRLVSITGRHDYITRIPVWPIRAILDGMNWRDRIEVNPGVLAGKPVVRGTRLAVELILELLAAGETESDLLSDYPRLTREDLLACLAYASHLAHEFRAYPLSAPLVSVDADSR
jgi:uncharacterized protein (DUF433 family)